MVPTIQSGSFPTVTRLGRALDQQNSFRNLPDRVALAVKAAAHTRTYAKGAVLFLEERKPHGVFILCSGRVRLSITGNNGGSHVLRMADELGEFLGVSAAISGEPYPFRSQTIDAAQVSFIERSDLLRRVREHPELAKRVVAQLSYVFSTACQQMHLLLRPAAEKLATLLLEWVVHPCRSASSLSVTKHSHCFNVRRGVQGTAPQFRAALGCKRIPMPTRTR